MLVVGGIDVPASQEEQRRQRRAGKLGDAIVNLQVGEVRAQVLPNDRESKRREDGKLVRDRESEAGIETEEHGEGRMTESEGPHKGPACSAESGVRSADWQSGVALSTQHSPLTTQHFSTS